MKDPREIIDYLSPTDALSILRTLANSEEALAKRIAEIDAAHLSGRDPEEVTVELYGELEHLSWLLISCILFLKILKVIFCLRGCARLL